MSRSWPIAALVALIVASACAHPLALQHPMTTSSRLTSPYLLRGEGSYAYGNFCGSRLPAFPEGADAQQRQAIARAIQPVDSLDRACQHHDICFEQLSHDNATCDDDFTQLMQYYSDVESWSGDVELGFACTNLAMEMRAGVALMKPKRSGPLGNVSGNAVAPIDALLRSMLFVIGEQTFPKEPGYCRNKIEAPYTQWFGARGY